MVPIETWSGRWRWLVHSYKGITYRIARADQKDEDGVPLSANRHSAHRIHHGHMFWPGRINDGHLSESPTISSELAAEILADVWPREIP